MALDDYFSDPSQDCLARLFDSVNSMDLSAAPILTRTEKFVMRASERKDIFADRFSPTNHIDNPIVAPSSAAHSNKPRHRPSNSIESVSSFEDGILIRPRDRDHDWDPHHQQQQQLRSRTRSRADSGAGSAPTSTTHSQQSPSDSSFTLGGSAVWVGDESGIESAAPPQPTAFVGSLVPSASGSTLATATRGRRSTDTSSASSHFGPPNTGPAFDHQVRPGIAKDTHFYHTFIAYKEHVLPIKMPLSTFPEEVGDVSTLHMHAHTFRIYSPALYVVLPYHTHSGVSHPTKRLGAPPSTSTHKWHPHTSHHNTL
jgi:hypothetical protein